MNKTNAETQVAPQFPVNITGESSAVGIGGVFSALVLGILYLRRKASRDGTEIIKDRTEGLLVETLMKERDGARLSEREAWTRANDLAVTNARLEATNQYQKEEIDRLRDLVDQLQIQFDEVKMRLQHLSAGATGHSGFNPHQ